MRSRVLVRHLMAIGLAVAVVAGATPRVTAADSAALAVALDAARWIRASAIVTPQGTSWPGTPGDPKTVGPGLYSGVSGVVLFYLELLHATGRSEYRDSAKAGADYLLSTIDTQTDAGLYTGLAGIGFTLSEVARATGDAKYREGAKRIVAALQTKARRVGAGVEWSEVTDIIDGSSGVGLFLLYAARELDAPAARDLAAQAGRRLLELGQSEAGGQKWAMSPRFARLMPNFSHGTAGIAYFLASLYQETKEPAFLDGALAGARYIQAIARTDGDICLVFHHEPEEEGRTLYYLGWCHGPAGTARLWYRLWQVTGDESWLDWTKKSARGLLTSGIPERQTPGFWNNVSQCCGSAGVAEFFLALHRVTKNPEYLAFSRRVTDQLLARATRDATGTRWVQAENRVQPDHLAAQTGWMQGAAGIGAWLVRLDAFERGKAAAFRLPDSPF